ncbi:hypothetical protein D3227_13305 [Mesorhizobium waimense]|uniref:Uncharacterized protein n=1 Tax=Mesorhizobium waimense TaxID=1300307 RepID=A0A3A5L0B3_9HYPH|nr:hypothetical protein [Mesorhizobium waimense]RJT39185.1 hypothetical protein D3227_13305 [Mesorhizobium waimense]
MDRTVSDRKRLSAFDLDALREAFKKSTRENDIGPADWAEHARLFVEQAIQGEPSEEPGGQSTQQ